MIAIKLAMLSLLVICLVMVAEGIIRIVAITRR